MRNFIRTKSYFILLSVDVKRFHIASTKVGKYGWKIRNIMIDMIIIDRGFIW